MESVLENPVLPFAIVSMIPAAAWVVSIIGWMISDEIGNVEGFFSIGLVFGLCVLAVTTSHVAIAMAACFSLLVAGGMYPLVRGQLNRRAHLMIDLDIMRSAYRQLDTKNTNVGAKVQLARMCYKRGMVGSAVALMDEAVGVAPNLLEDERRTLESWRALHGKTVSQRDVRCPKCNATNKPSERYCQHCKVALLINLAGGGQVLKGTPLKVFWLWLVAVASLVVAPALAFSLAAAYAVPAILGLLTLSGLVLYRILRSPAY